MSNREAFVAGLGMAIDGTAAFFTTASLAQGSLTWLPAFVTTQAAWNNGSSYAASSDLACGGQVTSHSATYVCITAGGAGSTADPGLVTTTQGHLTTVQVDGYNWLCIGNTTPDYTTLANANQAVSQIIWDNRPADSFGDTMIQYSISLATAGAGGSGNYVGLINQYLNQDGTTYGSGLGSGSSIESTLLAVGNVSYPTGKSSPILGNTSWCPMGPGKFRPCIVNQIGAALSASTHVVALRTCVFGLNQ